MAGGNLEAQPRCGRRLASGEGALGSKLGSLLGSSGLPSTLAALPKGRDTTWAAAKDRSADHRQTYAAVALARGPNGPDAREEPYKLRCFRAPAPSNLNGKDHGVAARRTQDFGVCWLLGTAGTLQSGPRWGCLASHYATQVLPGPPFRIYLRIPARPSGANVDIALQL